MLVPQGTQVLLVTLELMEYLDPRESPVAEEHL